MHSGYHIRRMVCGEARNEGWGIELTALETERKRQRLVTVGARWIGLDSEPTATGQIDTIDTANGAHDER